MDDRDASIFSYFVNAAVNIREKKTLYLYIILSITRDIIKIKISEKQRFNPLLQELENIDFITSFPKFLQKRFKSVQIMIHQLLHSHNNAVLLYITRHVTLFYRESIQYDSIDDADMHNLHVIARAVTVVHSLH